MERLVISCKMLSDELHKVCEGKKNIPRIIELERGMHNNPKRLQEILQKQIHENQDVDEIVLTYGLCGNGTLGLMSPKTKLIIPKFDDCISQLLYQDCIGRKKRKKPGAQLCRAGCSAGKTCPPPPYGTEENVLVHDSGSIA